VPTSQQHPLTEQVPNTLALAIDAELTAAYAELVAARQAAHTKNTPTAQAIIARWQAQIDGLLDMRNATHRPAPPHPQSLGHAV
jgi:hypothetical protein